MKLREMLFVGVIAGLLVILSVGMLDQFDFKNLRNSCGEY